MVIGRQSPRFEFGEFDDEPNSTTLRSTTVVVDSLRHLSYDAGMNKNQTKNLPRPTDAELELLRVLWSLGPSTVREIHEALPKQTGYTTTLKILQKMAEKRLVTRDESQKSHVYSAACEAESTQRQLVRHLLGAAFGDSPGKLVMQALSEQRATPEELTEIKRLLANLEKRGHDD
jgi:BlaI family penicillinase repressor